MFKKEKSRFSLRTSKVFGVCSVFLGLTILGMTGPTVQADGTSTTTVTSEHTPSQVANTQTVTAQPAETAAETTARKIRLKQQPINYKVQYLDTETGQEVATSPAKIAMVGFYEGEIARATVTETAELPTGYQLVADQDPNITQEIISSDNTSKTITFRVKKIAKVEETTGQLDFLTDAVDTSIQPRSTAGAQFRSASAAQAPSTGETRAGVDDSKYLQGERTYIYGSADGVRSGKHDQNKLGDITLHTKENTDGTFDVTTTAKATSGGRTNVTKHHIGYALYQSSTLLTPTTVTANGTT